MQHLKTDVIMQRLKTDTIILWYTSLAISLVGALCHKAFKPKYLDDVTSIAMDRTL